MNLEFMISDMMKINILARLWHWKAETAHEHTTYEQFLTQNEQLTDSFVESILGNDIPVAFEKVGVKEALVSKYDAAEVRGQIAEYRTKIIQVQKNIEELGHTGSAELIAILDGAVELSSKTLYLLKLK